LIIYAPKLITPKKVDKLASQVDVVPTLLGLLHQSYEAKFYGDDILRDDHKARAFIGNYQKLGLLITYYQSASWLYKHHALGDENLTQKDARQ